MRVDAYSKINQIYEPGRKAGVRSTAKASAKDELCISSTGKDYQAARQALTAVPDIREDRVRAIRAEIDAGSYQVSADSFAAKVIARYEELSF